LSRIAVIGSGISGLASAYYLSRKHEVSVFERESRLGGHTHTVRIDSSRGPLAIDTGFIVHNDRTYPNLVKLLDELGVPRTDSDMSFGVSCGHTGYEYSTRGFAGFFSQKRNIFRALPYRLFREILRFNREAPGIFKHPEAAHIKVGDFLTQGRFSDDFKQFYLFPMASAVWSSAPDAISEFPATMLIRFFENHNFLTTTGQFQWKTIPGGCSSYIEPIIKPFKDRIFPGAKIRSVSRGPRNVILRFLDDRPDLQFDHAVFAVNADCVLPLIESPTDAEREVLRHFKTTANQVVLHTDDDLLPRRPAARASWNCLLHGGDSNSRSTQSSVTMTYHMNRLQSLPRGENYCVTLNPNRQIRNDKILRRFVYHHPLYTLETMAAQRRWKEISGVHRFHFAGAYWFYGFHEDGLNSALRVARCLKVPI
jgi:uncharacterized protein